MTELSYFNQSHIAICFDKITINQVLFIMIKQVIKEVNNSSFKGINILNNKKNIRRFLY